MEGGKPGSLFPQDQHTEAMGQRGGGCVSCWLLNSVV